MGSQEFKFDPNQDFQQDAIESVVGLFEGQPADAEGLLTTLSPSTSISVEGEFDLDVASEVGAIGNRLMLDGASLLENLQAIQDRNGLEVADQLADDALDFDVEMETGTGKTYVYLRTIFELNRLYGFSKFVILVPSVAIREGVSTSVESMQKHFHDLYAIPFDFSVYSGKAAEEVQSFATSTSVQIMVMTIASLRGDKNTRIIHQERDKLNGLRPIDYLAATRPIVIMDEPQNMESELSGSAVEELNPTCTLRYSATHRRQRNVVYRLDPVDAHDLGLVKQIVVADVVQEGADATPYIKLMGVERDPFRAKLELVCRNRDGVLSRKTKKVAQDQDLAVLTGNPAYENNWRVNGISLDPHSVELTNHDEILEVGETIGDHSDSIYREMIRETIREHLRKERELRPKGIKVLSLFFVDKVANYLKYGDSGENEDGKFARWFDELFEEERKRHPSYAELLPQEPEDLRRAYFAEMKKGGTTTYVDSSGTTKKDDDAYDLIMREKARLLSQDEPVRFIFSHSALREGWDNPNVFQICALREMGNAMERRQTIGRGLRLPVDQNLERIPDRSIAQLTVVANESYAEFARSLQEDYIKAGVSMGFVRKGEFAKLPPTKPGESENLGYHRSTEIWEHLYESGYLDEKGRVLGSFTPEQIGFTLGLSEEYSWAEDQVIEILEKCRIETYVKSKRKRVARKLNKEIFLDPEFEEFWHRISRRTTYRVSLDREKVIGEAVKAIKLEPRVRPLRVQVTRSGLKLLRGGTKGEELASRSADLAGTYDLPDIVTELQEETSLTSRTLVDILIQSDRLEEFIGNPNDFIQMVKKNVKNVMASVVVEGIQYEEISGSIYEMRELQQDGLEERDRFTDQLYKVKNKQKTMFDSVIFESDPERRFAELLDSREDVKLFMKLPAKFKVPTPVGDYNPDWAILKQEEGQEKIYMIRETKSTSDDSKLRPDELAKIRCGTKHFAAIGIDNYAKSTPEDWNLGSVAPGVLET